MQLTSRSPRIEAQRYNLHVVQHSVPFPVGNATDSIAMGINSFGIGGNNAHAIVEEYQPIITPIIDGHTYGHHNGDERENK
ncbi:unnamed protein product, partial [Adineta ricciae]